MFLEKSKPVEPKNFIYEMVMQDGQIGYIYRDIEDKEYKDVLLGLDGDMDRIIGETLSYFYNDNIEFCKGMVEKLKADNPLGYSDVEEYEVKYKKFLAFVADGKDSGMIRVKGNRREECKDAFLDKARYDFEGSEAFSKDGKAYVKLKLKVRLF